MSTLTRVNSHNSRKPQYKDYVSFLEAYKNGKKDEQDGGGHYSLTSSGNTSSSSVFSDASGAKKPTASVKTEMFIEIKSPPSFPSQVFQVRATTNKEPVMPSVCQQAKLFEKQEQPRQQSFGGTSVEEISKKFREENKQKSAPKKSSSIGEVSKIFEACTVDNNHRKPIRNFNAIPKPFQAKVNASPAPSKPAILSPKPLVAAAPPQFPKLTTWDPSKSDNVDSGHSSLASSAPSPPQSISPPPTASPPPPPPPPQPPKAAVYKASIQVSPPPPPPPPPQAPRATKSNGQSATLDRNDPRVKKAVYGALRNMYGSYHDQANDYLATLPRNRVKKNNGLDSIINSIASQGGLEKLNGRVNPSQEIE